MTVLLCLGCLEKFLSESQLKVVNATIIIIATKAAIGIYANQSFKKTTKHSKNTPATSVDKRVRAPEETLIIDCPIIAQPAIPPINPLAILAIP